MLAGLDCRLTSASFLMSLAVGAAMWLTPAVHGQVPCSYSVELLPNPSPCPFWDRYIVPTGISPNGRWVCGSTGQCGPAATEAVVVDTQTMQLRIIPRPPGIVSAQCRDVNDAGFLVGRYDTTSTQYGFIYDLNTNQFIHQLASDVVGGVCSIEAINSTNVACGTRNITGSPEWKTTAFRWSAATGFDDLGLFENESTSAADINDETVVTGTVHIGDATRPFLWDDRGLVILGSIMGLEAFPMALNSDNQVVGSSATVQGGLAPHAFINIGEHLTDLGTLPGDSISHALAISDTGLVVGLSRSFDSPQSDRAVLWVNGSIRNLNEMVPVNSEFTGILSGNAISLDGVIAASAYLPGEGVACLLYPIEMYADVTGDCRVSVPDLLMVINEWGKSKSLADINQDETVNSLDIMEVIRNWQ